MSSFDPPSQKPRTDADKGSSQTLFLSLFLLLLAFFILLNSMSTIEEGRSNEVLESVQDAFPSSVRAKLKESFLADDPGQAIGEALRARLGTVFRETIPLVEITADPTGNPLYITVPSDQIFASTAGQVTLAAEDLAGRLAPILEQPPAGSLLFLDILFGRDLSGDAALDTSVRDTVVFAASSTVARFAELGLPKDRISTGVEQADPEMVRFIFRTRPARVGGRAGGGGG